MSDYKVVPVEPTAEMVEAAQDAYMPFGDMEMAIRMAVLAAPAVQGEPDVEALLNRIIPRIDAGGPNPIDPDIHCCEWTLHRERERIHAEFADALTTPQPAEQQPKCSTCRDVGIVGHSNICPECVETWAAPEKQPSRAAAEQQPAPDVAGLVEALSIARDYVFSSLEEKKLALAGYPQMWRCEQDDLAMIDATLSAYRKETSHDK